MLMLQDNLSLTDTKLITLAVYSPLTEMESGKSYIQPCSLLVNGAENLPKDSKIGPFFLLCPQINYYVHKLHRYLAFLFLHFSSCINFANPVIFRTSSPYLVVWLVPHSTSIMCRGN